MKKTIVIATRESELALWQSKYVANIIEAKTNYKTSLLPMTTEGDQKLSVSLHKIGGKGLFLKELEHSMLTGKADVAVHSMKDVPAQMPAEFTVCAVFPRADASDAFVSNHYQTLDQLPKNAIVGTSSLRRQAQVLRYRPDLIIKPLRGNVNTRLKKLDEGQYDAIILASAGLIRLDKQSRIASCLMPPEWLPAVAQGAVGVECLADNNELIDLFAALRDEKTWQCIQAERALNTGLNGSCSVAIGAYTQQLDNEYFQINAAVFSPDGKRSMQVKITGKCPETIGKKAAENLLAGGAQLILDLAQQT